VQWTSVTANEKHCLATVMC